MTIIHPIQPVIRDQVEQSLRAIEVDRDVRILYACESGSRGWGFASPDSDYDVRFIYIHVLPWYLKVSPQERDVIESPLSGVLDINGWELRKALGLLKKGNATVIEWLYSPIVYRSEEPFLSAVQMAAQQIHQPEHSFHHYIHMARKNYREYLCGERVRLKKYLYVLRPVLASLWIEQGRGVVPMRFQDLVDSVVTDPYLRAAIDQLLVLKRMVPESEYSEPLPIINIFLDTELARLASYMPSLTRGIDFSVLDRLLFDTVMAFS